MDKRKTPEQLHSGVLAGASKRLLSPKPPPLAPLKGFETVAIGAAYFAFGYFRLDAGPSTALREQVGYLICFVAAYMVEFEDADVGVTAIDTGM